MWCLKIIVPFPLVSDLLPLSTWLGHLSGQAKPKAHSATSVYLLMLLLIPLVYDLFPLSTWLKHLSVDKIPKVHTQFFQP